MVQADTPDINRGSDASEREAYALGAALLQALAVYLKASWIYPENNQRVVESSAIFLDRAKDLGSAVHWISIRVAGTTPQVDGHPVEERGPLFPWLLERFESARLAGLEIGPDANPEALARFGEAVRRMYGHPDADEFEGWSIEETGLRPLDLIIAGIHHDGDETLAGSKDRPEDRRVHETDHESSLDPDSLEGELFAQLSEDEEIVEHVDVLEQELREKVEESSDLARIDFLEEIVKALPAEILRDPRQARAVAERVLEQALREFRARAAVTEATVRTEFCQSAYSVARRYFEVQTALRQVADEELPSGRPEDEAIHEDLDALLQEFESFPALGEDGFATDDRSFAGEVLGIYLHELVAAEDPNWTSPREREVLAALAAPTDGDLAVLETYVDPYFSGECEDPERYARVIELLQRAGRVDLLHDSRHLDPESVTERFPERFGLFVDALDPQEEEDRETLRRVLLRIGSDRIRDAFAHDPRTEKLLTARRIQRLLHRSGIEALALVRPSLDHGGHDEAVRYLRRLGFPKDVTAALDALDPPSLLPTDYLRDLASHPWGGDTLDRLRDKSFTLLARFIAGTAEDPALHNRRLYAIRALRHLPSIRCMNFLEELKKSGGLLALGKATRAVRKAATETLLALGS